MSYPFSTSTEREAAICEKARVLSRSGDPLGVLIGLNDIACNPTRSQEARREALDNASVTLETFSRNVRNGVEQSDVEACCAIMKILREGAPSIEEAAVGNFHKRFLPGRIYRPMGNAGRNLRSNTLPFDDSQFHFDHEEMESEILWSGDLCGIPVCELIQPYPYGPNHTLLIPDRAARRPQLLQPDLHQWAQSVVLSTSFPGFVLAWNSLGDGGGSVNHQHFHCLTADRPFPVEESLWRHFDGPQDYPTTVVMFTPDQAGESDRFLRSLNCMGMAYNVLYSTNTYFFPRSKAYCPDPSCGWWAVIELAGLILCTSYVQYQTLNAETIAQEYAKLRV